MQKVFKKNNNAVYVVIIGGSIEPEKRIEVIRYIFNAGNATSVHLKERSTGPEDFVAFVNNVLKAY